MPLFAGADAVYTVFAVATYPLPFASALTERGGVCGCAMPTVTVTVLGSFASPVESVTMSCTT